MVFALMATEVTPNITFECPKVGPILRESRHVS